MALKIGISGKRIISQTETEELHASIEKSIRNILRKSKATEFIGFTPLAIGADTIFAEVVTKVFNMPLQIVLPFSLDEYKKDFSEKDFETLTSYKERFPTTEIVSTNIPSKDNERSEAYFKVGKYLVDTCNEMIFVWDENKPSGKGGTADVISYYFEKKNERPVECITLNEQMEDVLNSDIQNEFIRSNNKALKRRDNYKLVWRLAIFLGWLAVVFFAINTAFDTKLKPEISLTLVCLEFILVFSVFILIMRAKATNYHGQYLKERLRAETLRVLKYFYHANVEIKVSDLTSSTDKELYNLVQNINKQIKESKYNSKWYANYSIKLLINEQMKYHQDKIRQSGNKFHWLERLNLIIAIFFMINLVAHLSNSLLHYFYESHLEFYSHGAIIFLNILLPASYAAIEGILYFQEWAVLKKYSISATESLKDILKVLPKDIEKTDDTTYFNQQAIALNLTSSIMLTDNRNWNLIFEDKNNYHWVI
jgi:hypothetical protein